MENVIELKTGVVRKKILGSKKVSAVTLEPLKVRHMLGLDFADPEKSTENMATLISRMSNLTYDEVLDLEMQDWSILSGRVEKIVSGK